MPNIRDEASKVVDVRIPLNGYRRYIKELSRTGAFGQLQHENMLIILLEAVEELQQQVAELNLAIIWEPEESILNVLANPTPGAGQAAPKQEKSDKTAKNKEAETSKRTPKDVQPTTTTKPDTDASV
jgi:hypothetical protein